MHLISNFFEEFVHKIKIWVIVTFSVGLVAQSVEQRIENPRVGGSIPPQATIRIKQKAQHMLGFLFLRFISVYASTNTGLTAPHTYLIHSSTH